MNDAAPESQARAHARHAQVADVVREVGEQLFEQLACLAQTAAAACGAQGAGWQLHERQAIAGWSDVIGGLLKASSANDASTAGDTLVIPVGTGASQSAGVALPSMAALPDAAGVRTPVHLGGGEHVADLLLIGQPPRRHAGSRDATLCSLARMAALVIEAALSRIAGGQPAAQGASGEEAARAREDEWRLVVDSSPSMLSYWDHALHNRYANHAYATWFGVRPEAIRGRHIRELLGEDLFRSNLPHLESALAGSVQVFERSIETPMGLRHSSVRYQPHFAGARVVGLLVEVTDVSHLKSAEQGLRTEIENRQATETLLRASLDELAEARDELRDLYDNAPCGYFSLDAEGRFVRVNRAMEHILGCPAQDLLAGKGLLDFAAPDSAARFSDSFRRLREHDLFDPQDLELRCASGDTRHVQVHSTAVRGEGAGFVRTRSAMVDISGRQRSRQQLEALVREQHAMLNNDMVGIIRVRGRQVVWVNRAFERMFEYTADEIIGKSTRILHPDGRSYVEQGRQAYPLLQALGTYRAQVRMVRKSGATLWADMSGAMLSIERDESLWMAQDITALQNQRESVESLAFQDSLTNLTNRAGFMRWMTRALRERVDTGDLLALCFIDLDGFKPINDEHGHDAGDEVLGVIAQRLLQGIRADDLAVRLGGDEFLVVLPHASSHDALRLVCERLIDELRQPITFLNGTRVRVSASMGVSLCPDHATTTEGLLRCADEAMYLAKASGRDNWRLFQGGG